MAKFQLPGIAIKGISCAVPEHKVVYTDFYERFGKDHVDDFVRMTGVRSFYHAREEQTASDLCYVAARRLLEDKKVPPEEIGALVFISQTPDYRLPATACVLHKRLGLPKQCMAFDVNLGCSGFVYGLNITGSLMQTSNISRALLLFGDTSTKTGSPEDRSGAMLFGDGGAAILLQKEDHAELHGELMSDGEGFKAIIIPSGAYRNRNGSYERTMWADGNIRSDYDGYMNGTDVFSFTVTQVPRQIKRVMDEDGKTPDDYDALVLHQANLLILKQIAKKTRFGMDKIPVSMDRFGNTSGTSIPLTLCDTYGDRSDGRIHLLLSGFGVGLSWGTVYAELDCRDILPIVFSDECYTEGGVSHD